MISRNQVGYTDPPFTHLKQTNCTQMEVVKNRGSESTQSTYVGANVECFMEVVKNRGSESTQSTYVGANVECFMEVVKNRGSESTPYIYPHHINWINIDTPFVSFVPTMGLDILSNYFHYKDSFDINEDQVLLCLDILSNYFYYKDSFTHRSSKIQHDSEVSEPFSETEKINIRKDTLLEIRKDNQTDSIEEIIEHIDRLGYPECSERIDFLNNTDNIEEGELPLSLESAKGFLLFFTQFNVLGEPVLGLFPKGTLSVGWRLADNKHLLVEPLDSQNASFALIGPSYNNPNEKFRLNGRGKIPEVIKTLRKQGVDQWRNS